MIIKTEINHTIDIINFYRMFTQTLFILRQEQLNCLESLEVAMTVASGAAQETGKWLCKLQCLAITTTLKLTYHIPLKMMVGRWKFLLKWSLFRVDIREFSRGVTFDIGRAKELGMMHVPYSILELFWAWKIRAKGVVKCSPPVKTSRPSAVRGLRARRGAESSSSTNGPRSLGAGGFFGICLMQGNSFSVPQQSSLKYSRCFEKKRPNP